MEDLSYLQRNNAYLARQEIERIKNDLSIKDHKRLELHGFKVYSQGDEDGIIEEIFRRIGVTEGTFCEIGVEKGLECNSLYLLHKGWTGYWIEGNETFAPALEQKFSSLILSNKLTVAMTYVTAENIDFVFNELKVPKVDLDFMSIDIDGNDKIGRAHV